MEKYKPKGKRNKFMWFLILFLAISAAVIYESYHHPIKQLIMFLFG